ncbi:MAG: DUF2807 domain-containing protein [Bacteroidales bacterium]|nr:MAG: DUF2807 domain-containing protein [Bacteroidales bacterium]
MRKIAILLSLFFATCFAVNAQTTEERALNPFDKLIIDSDVKVFLTKGNEEKVKIIVSGIELSEVETTVKGKTLQIQLSRGVHMDISAELYITYKEIRDISVNASGRLSVQGPLVGDKVVLVANTNAQIDTELDLKTVDVKVGQGASIRISGKVGSIDAKVSTRGILSALDVQSDSTYIQVGSAGTAKITGIYLLDAKVGIGGTLTYSGAPKVKNIKSGLGATVNAIE